MFCLSLFLFASLSYISPVSPLSLSNLQLHCSHGDYSNEVLLRTTLSLRLPNGPSVSQTVSPSLSLSVVSEIVVQVDRFQISVMQRRNGDSLV